MKKLIVHTNNAPTISISAILATWSTLANMVEHRVRLAKGCDLVWELSFQFQITPLDVLHQNLSKGAKNAGHWEAYGMLSMVFEAKIPGTSQNQLVDVPLTHISQIMIYEDGTFCWHGDVRKPEENLQTLLGLAEAVSRGRLPSGHHYEANWIPRLKNPHQ